MAAGLHSKANMCFMVTGWTPNAAVNEVRSISANLPPKSKPEHNEPINNS